jgi:hypothetical protein
MLMIYLYLTGVYLIGVCLMSVHLMSVSPTGAHLIGVHLTGVYFIGVYLTGVHLMGVCTSRVYTSFTSLPCAQATGGENPCIDTKDVLRLLIVGDSAVRLLVTLGARSAW